KKLELAAGKSDLKGELSLKNLERPAIALRASSSYLDLSDFLPKTTKKEEKETNLDLIGKSSGTASLTVAKGRAAGIDYSDLKTDLVLANGHATAKTMEVKAMGGSFSGSGTELDLASDSGPFHLLGKIENMDMSALLARFAGEPNLLRGRLA